MGSGDQVGARGLPRKALRRRFVLIALGTIVLIGLWSVVAAFVVGERSERLEAATQAVQTTERQRMLVQRIALDASQLPTETSATRRRLIRHDLGAQLELFASQHAALRDGLGGIDAPADLSPEAAQLFESGASRLDDRAAELIGQGEAVLALDDADLHPGAPAITRLVDNARVDLLGHLNLLVAEYERVFEQRLAALRTMTLGAIGTVGLLTLLWFLAGAAPLWLRLRQEYAAMVAAEQEARARSERHRLAGEIAKAVEMADDEPSLVRTAERVLGAIDEGEPAEVRLADSSRSHLELVAFTPGHEPPGCGVTEPGQCRAVHQGRSLSVASSGAMAVCPFLGERGGDPVSAVCVPVGYAGHAVGVIHAVGVAGQEPASRVALEQLATHLGVRLGMLRALDAAQLQASTDGLTGLANRRSASERIRERLAGGDGLALAMLDLDHFKRLNDEFGHAAGDQALRRFATVLAGQLRDGDLASRHGGEEFVVALPGLRRDEAVPVLDRISEALTRATLEAGCPSMTFSAGVADTSQARDLDELLRLADEALLRAKDAGRDRVVASEAGPARPRG
ncbi:MAG: GGDEF domain-containing protein [Egibacteraceae bacterium]